MTDTIMKEINQQFRQVNKDITELNKAPKQQQKEKRQRFNNSTLSMLQVMADEMQRHHASNQSIKLALKGTYEFFKVVSNAQVPQASINSLLRNEHSAQQSTQIFSTPLSEIEAKELNWLWMNRIPQGKITLLEGDPYQFIVSSTGNHQSAPKFEEVPRNKRDRRNYRTKL